MMLTLGAILALGVMGYTGLLLYVVKAIPLWASVWLPILFTISAISTGLSANAAATLNAGHGLSHCAHKFHVVLVALEIVAVLALFASVRSEAAGMASVTKIVSGSLAPMFWIGFVVFGLALPLLGGSKFMIRSCSVNADGSVCAHGGEEAKSCVYNEYGVLVGGFCLRAFIVLGAVYIF